MGSHLDLDVLYNKYINSNLLSPLNTLLVFSQPHKISQKLKQTRQYREYLEKLLENLIYFFEWTKPLQDLDGIFSKVCFLCYLFFTLTAPNVKLFSRSLLSLDLDKKNRSLQQCFHI